MATYVTHAVSAAESTTTSTSLQDKVTLTFTAGAQEANAVYYIVAWAQVYNGSAGAKVDLHLANTTDTVTYQDLEIASALVDTTKIGQMMLGIYTAASTPVEKVFKIRYAAVSGTAKIQKAKIFIFKKGPDDAHNESLSKTDATATYADKASVTFTPASQGFYWLLGCAEYFIDASDRPYGRITVGGTLQAAVEIVETPTNDSRHGIGISWVKELAASSQTVAFGVRDTSTFSDVYNARIICMRLSDFPAYWHDDETTNDTTPATTFEAKTSITQTLAAVEHLAIACVPARTNSTNSINTITTLKVDSTVEVENLDRPRQLFGIEAHKGHTMVHNWTGSGSSTTVEAGWHFNSSASGNLDDNSLLVIQLEASAGGTTYNETVSFSASSAVSTTGIRTLAATPTFAVSSGLTGTTTRTTAQTATLATQAAITPTATRTAAFTTAFAAAAAVDHVLTVTMAPIVSFATSAGMTASAVLAAAASVTFAAVNALIGVFDGDGSAPGRRRLKRWLSWPPFPWKQWFR